MTFFGLTHLGYQNPIGQKMIVNPKGESYPQDDEINLRAGLPSSCQKQQAHHTDTCNQHHQPLPYSTDTHHGSFDRYKEMVRKGQIPRGPNQLYKMPVTDSQQYGWMTSKAPEPWTRIKRFPRKNSEMTKFVVKTAENNPGFTLF